jgi:hypothetical protein
MDTNNNNHNNLINLLKNVMSEGEINFIDFILNNTEQIKKLDNISFKHRNKNTNYSNSYYYEQKTNPKNVIAELKKNTLFHFFRINSWSELINVVTLNNNMRGLINSGEIPSYTIFKIVVNSFKKIFGEYVCCNMLHFLTATSDNYLIYILTQWLKQTKTSHIGYYAILPEDKVELFKNLNDDDIPNSYIKAIESIKFSKINNDETWNITSHPIYYENSKLYVICTSYDGMGWYKTLSISMKKRNKNCPFVFCLDGGSSGIDRKNNLDFFQNNQPPRNKLLSFTDMEQHIKNNTFGSVIFQLE